MPAATALLVLGTLDLAGVTAVVMGGWGIDALVGEQQRPHRDLDLILDHGDLGIVLAAGVMAARGVRSSVYGGQSSRSDRRHDAWPAHRFPQAVSSPA